MDITEIIRESVNSVSGEQLLSSALHMEGDFIKVKDILSNETVVNLSDYNKIQIAGAGKASAGMCVALERLLRERISGGMVIVPAGCSEVSAAVGLVEAGHPYPDDSGTKASLELMQIADSADEKTLIIFLLSGGASSLFSVRADGVSAEDEKRLVSYMMESGADIRELNAVRRVYSVNKAGGFAVAAYPATVLSLVISDVTGNDLSVIGSAPSYQYEPDINFLLYTIKKYNLLAKCPDSILPYLTKAVSEKISRNTHFKPTKALNLLIGDNVTLLENLERRLKEQGFEVVKILTPVTGDTDSAVSLLDFQYRGITSQMYKRPLAIISGGETTTTVTGSGRGGRNQELAVKFLVTTKLTGKWTFYSVGSDGIDGNSDAAGGMVSSEMLLNSELQQQAQKYLLNSDSNSFLRLRGGAIITGPTGANVMDIQVLVAE